MKKARALLLTAFAAILLASLLFVGGCGNQPEEKSDETEKQQKSLFAYVGANLKEPVSEIAASYEKKTGVKVELTFNNSGAILNQIEMSKKGDICIPGGMPFVEKAKEKNFVDQVVGPIAYHTPVIITPEGNPAQISVVEDLAKEGVKLVMPDQEATAIGKSATSVFAKIGKTAEIEKNVIASLESPAKVLAAIEMGQGNAGIVEVSNTINNDKIEVVEIDPQVNVIDQIPVVSLVYTKDKELTSDFLEYVEDNGPAVFKKYGFKIEKP